MENAKNLGRSDDAKRGKKKDGLLDEKHRIAVQGIFVGIIIKAGGASVKVTDLLFLFAVCKKSTRKTGILARTVLLFVNNFD